MRLLDAIEPYRHDVLEIVDRLNNPDEDDDGLDRFGWCHPIGALCGDSTNDTLVVRDLDGHLAFIWADDSPSMTYHAGLFCQDHISDLELEAHLERGRDGSSDLDAVDVEALIGLLPVAPGPVRRH